MNVRQLEDKQGNPIAPITMADSVQMVQYSGYTLQEQVEHMTISGITHDEEETLEAISGLTDQTVASIVSASTTTSGNCREELDALEVIVDELDLSIFPLKIAYTITPIWGTTYTKTISGSVTEHDNIPPDLTMLKITKQVNNGLSRVIFNSEDLNPSFNISDPIEGRKEKIIIDATTDKKSATASADRYICFTGASASDFMTDTLAKSLTKSLRASSSFTTSIRTYYGDYIWLIVPDFLKITYVTSSGIEVKLVEDEYGTITPQSLNISPYGAFKAYRTANPLDDNTWSLSITMTTA